ncbi:MAG: hypothetical protein QG567_991 [Campylobacterota bacterium]|nr:hypothetical protein [Campylobacterota bacterium]
MMNGIQSGCQNNGTQQYGQAGGNGNSQMRDIMQNLSPEDRSMIREKMSTMPTDDKMAMKEKLSQIDTKSMSQEELSKTFIDILNETEIQETSSNDDYLISVYA